jgi:hypothetical protein
MKPDLAKLSSLHVGSMIADMKSKVSAHRGRTAGEDGQEEKGNQMSKDERGWNSSLSEKPVRSRPRRLVDSINLTAAKKVHSLIDKVYKRKNLRIAWEKVS